MGVSFVICLTVLVYFNLIVMKAILLIKFVQILA